MPDVQDAPPAFALPVPGTDFWTLRDDQWITPKVVGAGTLAIDTFMLSFAEVRAVLDMGRDATVIDVGAFIGDSLWAFYEAGCRCIAFEPQADAFVCLRHNLPLAGCIPFAAGNGEAVELDGTMNGGNLGGRAVQLDIAGKRTLRLDDLAPNPNCHFLKIDAEGHEPFILDGAAQLIDRCRPVIWIEVLAHGLAAKGFAPDDLLKRLERTHRVLYTRPGLVGTGQPYDLLCIPR